MDPCIHLGAVVGAGAGVGVGLVLVSVPWLVVGSCVLASRPIARRLHGSDTCTLAMLNFVLACISSAKGDRGLVEDSGSGYHRATRLP